MLILLDPSSLSPALLSSVKSLIQQPKAEFTLVDPVVSRYRIMFELRPLSARPFASKDDEHLSSLLYSLF